MSRARIIAAATTLICLLALVGWQVWRERQIVRCQQEFGVWNGRSCDDDPRRIRIQRELQRT